MPFIRTAALSIVAVCAAKSGYAAARTWGNAGTDFNAGGSWQTGVVPGNADTALFNTAKATNPNLSASLTINNVDFSVAAASGYDLTSSNTGITLTLLNTTRLQ